MFKPIAFTMPLIVLGTFAAAARTEPQPEPAAGPRAEASVLAKTVDSFASRAVAAGLAPGLGVAVTLDGKVIYAKSHGAADATAGLAADDDTLWYLASTSKSFTGFGVALLAQRGTLRLDAPISALLPKARWPVGVEPSRLPLSRFLSHTHGLDDSAIVSSAAFTGAISERCWPQLLARAKPTGNQDLDYSNLGYNVAAMVIDTLRPEGWREFLAHEVFRPAGMTDTFGRVAGIDPRRIAKPHRFRADGRFETTPFFKTDATMNSAGGHLATVGDLARWTIVQMDGGVIDGQRVFPAEAVALGRTLLARQTQEKAKRFKYFDREGWGSGWDLGSYEGEPMVSRFGGYDSFHSHLSFLPRRRVGVVVMVSGGDGSSLAGLLAALVYDLEAGRTAAVERAEERLAERISDLALGKQQTAKSDQVRADRQTQPLRHPAADFTGRYFEPHFGEVEITVRDGHHEYRWGAVYGPAETFDAAKDQLRIEIAGSGSVLAFVFDEQGPARAVRWRDVEFARLAPDAKGALACD